MVIEQGRLLVLQSGEQPRARLVRVHPHPHGHGVDEQPQHALDTGRAAADDPTRWHRRPRRRRESNRDNSTPHAAWITVFMVTPARSATGERIEQGGGQRDVDLTGYAVERRGRVRRHQRRLVDAVQRTFPGPYRRVPCPAVATHSRYVRYDGRLRQSGRVVVRGIAHQQLAHQQRHRPPVEDDVMIRQSPARNVLVRCGSTSAAAAAAGRGRIGRLRSSSRRRSSSVSGRRPVDPVRSTSRHGTSTVSTTNCAGHTVVVVVERGHAELAWRASRPAAARAQPRGVDRALEVDAQLRGVDVHRLGGQRRVEQQPGLQRRQRPDVSQRRGTLLPTLDLLLAHRAPAAIGRCQTTRDRAEPCARQVRRGRFATDPRTPRRRSRGSPRSDT